MIRRTLAVLAFVLAPLSFVLVPAAFAPGAGATTAAPVQQCMKAGWQILTDALGQTFGNQGQCIAYASHHPVSLVDLVSTAPFTVTTTAGPAGCEIIGTALDATYPGDTSVGTVNLSVSGCVNFTLGKFEGSFTITTEVGTLSGSATGPTAPLANQLITLHVDSATGLFAGTTGGLAFSLSPVNSLPYFGTISVLSLTSTP